MLKQNIFWRVKLSQFVQLSVNEDTKTLTKMRRIDSTVKVGYNVCTSFCNQNQYVIRKVHYKRSILHRKCTLVPQKWYVLNESTV